MGNYVARSRARGRHTVAGALRKRFASILRTLIHSGTSRGVARNNDGGCWKSVGLVAPPPSQ